MYSCFRLRTRELLWGSAMWAMLIAAGTAAAQLSSPPNVPYSPPAQFSSPPNAPSSLPAQFSSLPNAPSSLPAQFSSPPNVPSSPPAGGWRPTPPADAQPEYDSDIIKASCAGCGSGGTCANNGAQYGPGGSGCVPGRNCCGIFDNDTCMGRLCGGLYEGLCCPDPCYEPVWVPEANSAFFQDDPRPVTQTRLRWDAGVGFGAPDTAEYFWGKIGTKGPMNPESSIHYNSLSIYQEVAAKNFSAFIEVPYLSVEPSNNPSAAGLGDMNVGVKSVLLDRELLLATFQFRTYIPVGNVTNGLGTGHVSLEPSLLTALKITPTTYLQAQIGEWIPIAGTPGFAGSIFEYHVAVNQSLYRNGDALDIIGTVEVNGLLFRGMYTDPAGNDLSLSGASLFSAGPGIRFVFCKNCDLGIGTAFDFGNIHGPQQLYRTEFRVRF